MEYGKIIRGTFIERPNRFVAWVEAGGKQEKVHVKNTGRCRELLIPGAEIYLEDHIDRMGNRKLRYSLIAVEKMTKTGKRLVNMDSQAPNKVVKEALEQGRLIPKGLEDVALLKSEYTYGSSRLDLYGEDSRGTRWLAEVKGVTLEENGTARFPDAPTERGVRHVEELIAAAADGYRTGIIFVVQMKGIRQFEPNDVTHPRFGEALRAAERAGVEIMAVDCRVEPGRLSVDAKVPVRL